MGYITSGEKFLADACVNRHSENTTDPFAKFEGNLLVWLLTCQFHSDSSQRVVELLQNSIRDG